MPLHTLKHPLRSIRLLAGLCLCLAFCSLAQGHSLLQLYDLARQHDAAYRGALAEVNAAKARAGQARAGLLPQLGLQADVTRTTAESSLPGLASGSNSFNSRGITLVGSQPLYHPAEKIAWDQGKEATKGADIALTAAAQQLMVDVASAYFDVLAAQSTLASVRALKQSIARQLQLAQRNFEIGNATITDSREAQARMDSAKAREIAAENDLHVKTLALHERVGQDKIQLQRLAEPALLPQLQPDTLDDWLALAHTHNARILQQTLALRLAHMDMKKSRAGRYPTVDLQVSAGTTHYSGNPGLAAALGGRKNASIGVQLNLPLFDGLLTQNRVRETLAEQDKANANLQDSRREAKLAVQSAFFGVQSGLAEVDALETALQSARSALEANQLGYEVGVHINIDVLNAQSQFHQAEDDLTQARYNVLVGLLRLKQAAGTLSETDLSRIDALLEAPPVEN